MQEPTIVIVLGATGDLMGRKIAPALYHLHKAGQLPAMFQLIGFARREMDNLGYREWIRGNLKFGSEDEQSAFLEKVTYFQGDLSQIDDYKKLGSLLGVTDDQWTACSNKLFYLAIPPISYATVFKNLAESGIAKECGDGKGWTRVLVEKPFGSNGDTAAELDALLSTLFREEQIYRIDHYLGKEMMQNILTFRFANNLFEGMWNNRHIEKIEIKFWETLGVESRGKFYDGVGALRDVGQNHILQILALLTMEPPKELTAEAVRYERASLLENLKVLSAEEIERDTYRAQYDGYLKVDGVAPDSQTETYFKVRLEVDNRRWERVPVIIEGGKSLKETCKQAVITFKSSPQQNKHSRNSGVNRIVISVDPEERISVKMWAKKPGYDLELTEESLEFVLRDPDSRTSHVEEYEKLLLDCIKGDQTLFTNSREVAGMWNFIDPLVSSWQQGKPALQKYSMGTDEPMINSEQITKGLNSNLNQHRTLGIIGLGKMGANLARRSIEQGWQVVGFNRTYATAVEMEKEGLLPVKDLKQLVHHLPTPRVVWLMLPAGQIIDEVISGENGLLSFMEAGDYLIDGGNCLFKDDVRRAELVESKGIHFVDIGVSGGPEGALTGPCLMIGGKEEDFRILEPIYAALSINNSYRFFPGHGAGHFVRMIHNAIEYGMMQSIGEGAELLKKSPYNLDLLTVMEIYNNKSVIESRLVGWLERAMSKFGQELEGISSTVEHSGEGEWSVNFAKEIGIVVPIIEGSLEFRKQSSHNPSFTGKVVSALRGEFGGHAVNEKEK